MDDNERICKHCKDIIYYEPFVTKRWDAINEFENYHTLCFIIRHRGMLEMHDMNPSKTESIYGQ